MSDNSQADGSIGRPGVFLSHSHSDREFARRLGNDLIRSGIQIWVDEAEIKLGDSLIRKIREGIDAMEYLVVVLSSASVSSEWVQQEVDVAMNHEIKGRRIKVLPILLQDCALPGFLEGKLYADFRDPSRYEESLHLILDRVMGTVRPKVPVLSKQEAGRTLLRAAVLDWEYYRILLDGNRLRLLAESNVDIAPDEVDFVIKSLIATLADSMVAICQYYDKYEIGEDYEGTWPVIETYARLLAWAASRGARHRIAEVYSWIELNDRSINPAIIR